TVTQQLQRKADRLNGMKRHLGALGPEQTLARGYSIVLDEAGAPIHSIKELPLGKSVKVKVLDGEVGATVTEA
ncbi:MAG: exodeoxyribonuclease VII large subunit, partial [Verrucomicrobiales bacterium]